VGAPGCASAGIAAKPSGGCAEEPKGETRGIDGIVELSGDVIEDDVDHGVAGPPDGAHDFPPSSGVAALGGP